MVSIVADQLLQQTVDENETISQVCTV